MDRSTPGEGPKRAFSGVKKLRQSRSEAFSGENYAFFSVLALFLCVLVAKSCVFMAFLGKKIRPQRSLESGLLCGFLRGRGRLRKQGFWGRKVEERRGLEKGEEAVGRLKSEKWRRYVGLCFESREWDGITDPFSTLTRYFFFLTCPPMQTIERGLQVVDFWRYTAVLWPSNLLIFGAFLALQRVYQAGFS